MADGKIVTAGATWEPWTDGYGVGFKVTRNDGRVRYVYLNPSQEDEGDVPTVFLYEDGHGDPNDGETVCYLTPFEPDATRDALPTGAKSRTHIIAITDAYNGATWAMADTIDGTLALWDQRDAERAAEALRNNPQYETVRVVEVFDNLADDGSPLPALRQGEGEREAIDLTAWQYNEHRNQLGDWCPHSGKQIKPGADPADDAAACPAVCPDSGIEPAEVQGD